MAISLQRYPWIVCGLDIELRLLPSWLRLVILDHVYISCHGQEGEKIHQVSGLEQ